MKELLEWLNQECEPGTKNEDLSHDFAEILQTKLQAINKTTICEECDEPKELTCCQECLDSAWEQSDGG